MDKMIITELTLMKQIITTKVVTVTVKVNLKKKNLKNLKEQKKLNNNIFFY